LAEEASDRKKKEEWDILMEKQKLKKANNKAEKDK